MSVEMKQGIRKRRDGRAVTVRPFKGGFGWISLTHLNQTPITGHPASLTVGEILLTNLDSYAGQTEFQTVPEPGPWLACCVGLVGFGGVRFYRRGRR